ncbi:hypothetical protein [Modestobacter altitudinis]|uniref:hypothetical protein n=1 Tax=Modestobacter altitudinis TaxID=2213158 RepID=UPI00110CFFF8|nr:hypothetical protein [Modestobacter altitudinis]
MTSRLLRTVAAPMLLLTPWCTGCTSQEAPAAGPGESSASASEAVPSDAAGLEALLVDAVPSGLPLVPDDELVPPAGAKTIDDVARYGGDAQQQRQVLSDYGYLRGWERFWRADAALTSVFLDQFQDGAGAGSYAEDLARNDAEYYGGLTDSAPDDLPSGCVTMARDEPAPDHGFAGPAAFAWCAVGAFTVSVAAVAATPADAWAELVAVTVAQLDRLPAG